MGGERDLVSTTCAAAHDSCTKVHSSTATKVNETVRSGAANAAAVASDACSKLHASTVAAAAKVKETVRSSAASANEYLSDPKVRDNISKFALNASVNAAKTIPGGVGTVVDIVAQSIPEAENGKREEKYIKKIEALEDEVKELKHSSKL